MSSSVASPNHDAPQGHYSHCKRVWTHILDRMEKRGLVKKVRDLPHRRLVRLAMTKKGKEKLGESTKVGWGVTGRLMSSFSEEDLHTFAGLLEKLRERAFEELYPGKAIEKAQIEDFRKIVRLLKKTDC